MSENDDLKGKILKELYRHQKEHNTSHMFKRYLQQNCGLLNSRGTTLIIELTKEGYLEDVQQTNVGLTSLGKRAAEFGYLIIKDEVKEEEVKQLVRNEEKEVLELKTLQFNYKWRFLIILAGLISIISLVFTIWSHFNPIKQ